MKSMTTAVLTTDINDRFWPDFRNVCHDVGADDRDLLKVLYVESGLRADAHNPSGNASGINQLMPQTLVNLGWTHGAAPFRRLTATEQLPWVRRYFRPHKGRLTSVGAIYTANFLPALLAYAGDPDYVLVAKGGQLGWAYASNAALDANGDYTITVRELELAVQRHAQGARWDELVARLEGRFQASIDLRATAGIQRALTALGHGPGAVDGIVGPRTRAAVIDFQKKYTLLTDGIVGPRTRAALKRELAAMGIGAMG